MQIAEIRGNVFKATVDVIAHGCNCQGIMGAGIALQVKNHFPKAYKEYLVRCIKGEYKLGVCLLVEDKNVWIANLATQFYTGPDARLYAVGLSVEKLRSQMEEQDLHTIGMPHIGCGLGGLTWKDVKPVIESTLNGSEIEVYAYYL